LVVEIVVISYFVGKKVLQVAITDIEYAPCACGDLDSLSRVDS
jgi:hypothetical protein